MRWKKKKKIYPRAGDTQVISKFLLFPKCLNNEWRWLEKAKIERQYELPNLFPDQRFGWIDVKWVD